MTDAELQAARDAAWRGLAKNPIRRAMLGRERCDAIVRVAADELAAVHGEYEASVRAAGLSAVVVHGDDLRRRVEARVRQTYHERAGFAFMTLVIAWAISAIVQVLVQRWLDSRGQQQ